jgi:hypothetical protein
VGSSTIEGTQSSKPANRWMGWGRGAGSQTVWDWMLRTRPVSDGSATDRIGGRAIFGYAAAALVRPLRVSSSDHHPNASLSAGEVRPAARLRQQRGTAALPRGARGGSHATQRTERRAVEPYGRDGPLGGICAVRYRRDGSDPHRARGGAMAAGSTGWPWRF